MRICLNEMVFYGYHGVHAEERSLGQRFVVTAKLFTDDALDEGIKHLEDTVDYTLVYEKIREVVETHQFQLLECCANYIADELLKDFPLLNKVKIRIEKPSVPIQGSLRSVEVSVCRTRA